MEKLIVGVLIVVLVLVVSIRKIYLFIKMLNNTEKEKEGGLNFLSSVHKHRTHHAMSKFDNLPNFKS